LKKEQTKRTIAKKKQKKNKKKNYQNILPQLIQMILQEGMVIKGI